MAHESYDANEKKQHRPLMGTSRLRTRFNMWISFLIQSRRYQSVTKRNAFRTPHMRRGQDERAGDKNSLSTHKNRR